MPLRYLENVVTLALDEDKCIGCGMCTEVCPHGVFELVDDTAMIVDRGACMECGACAVNCPSEALSVRAGVGCATAVIVGWRRGTEPSCECCAESARND